MAEAAVSFLLEQLKEVVIGYRDLIAGAENEFNLLKNDLDSLKAFLRKMAEKKKKDQLMEVLEKRIREVVYEVEDTIDTCLTKAIEAQVKAKNSRKPNFMQSTKRLTLATDVKAIREGKVLPLFEDAKKFADMQKIADGPGGVESPRTESKRDTPIRKNRVVGFKDEEKTITEYLMEKTNELDVISIVGIPGQGKTTLAWRIYENEDICYHFPIRVWVYISQVFNIRDVFLQIMRKFTPSQDPSNLKDNELAQIVRSCLEKEKFLLVLDDVWSVDAWNRIKEVLPPKNGEGKVLITSGETDVGKQSSSNGRLHQLRFLTQEESWKLLQYEVYGNLEGCPPALRSIGEHIAIKCDGVPLTIVVIGGVLVDQLMNSPTTTGIQQEWEKVAENALQKDKAQAQRITDVVALSYDRLRDDLRDCFIYMAVFPEDYEISAKTLCGLWIAEGYILPQNRKSLEECAEENLNDLICRNLLKVEKTNHMGKVKTCRVHGMIRAFCMTKSKEQDLFQEIKKSMTGRVSEVQKLHSFCSYSELSKFLSQNPNNPHVRSLLCFYKQPVELEPNDITVIPNGFPKLRILESKSIKFHIFPAKVTTLVHLRYLTLSVDNLTVLPQSISLLWNLQALIVETKSRSIEMKANIWRMIRLRHLKTKAPIILDSKWEGEAGQNLQTLDRLSPESCKEAISKKAKNLKVLGISGKIDDILQTGILRELHLLEKLKLVDSFTNDDRLAHLPTQNSFPPNLKRLSLTNTFLDWKHMSTLAKNIGTLEVLRLKKNAFIGIYWKATDDRFPRLQGLLISYADLVIWEASTESFPSLRSLALENCENLNEIPEAITHTLERLDIKRVPESAVVSARRIVEQKKKRAQSGSGMPLLDDQLTESSSNVQPVDS